MPLRSFWKRKLIIQRFERKGLKLIGLKMICLNDAVLDEWYAHHKDKPFFGGLKNYMKSYPVIAMLLEGKDVVATVRKMVGITKARDAESGTIRGDFAMSQQYNLVHASETSEIAQKEEKLIFRPSEIFNWRKVSVINTYLENELSLSTFFFV